GGFYGVRFRPSENPGVNNTGIVTNAGAIVNQQRAFKGMGITLGGGGTVVNSGVISAYNIGVDLTGGGTIVNSGTIAATGTRGNYAVRFDGTGSSLLVLEHGYHLAGTVMGSGTVGASNTLELAGSLGAPL